MFIPMHKYIQSFGNEKKDPWLTSLFEVKKLRRNVHTNNGK